MKKKPRAKKAPVAFCTYSVSRNGRTKLPTMHGNIGDLAIKPRLWRLQYEVDYAGQTILHGDEAKVTDTDVFLCPEPVLLVDLLTAVVNPHVDWLLAEYKGRIIDVRFRIDPVRK